MLRELWIKNFAIIDDLKVRFEDGLNVLTGETGAGKSIIVDSLSLALGSRAQSELIRSGEKEAVVQAYFELEGSGEIPDIGIDISDSLILRRSISSTGKSRAYINDTMVSVQSLAGIGKYLVDIHGQHEHQSLLSIDKHRLFLDSYGKLQEDGKGVESLYREVSVLKAEEADLKQKVKERAHRLDLLRFQINEIEAASLKTGEKEDLFEKRTILSNLNRLVELTETAYSMVYSSEHSCIERLSSIISKVKEMLSVDPSVSDILNMLESARPLIEDAAASLRGYKDKYDLEPERLAEIEERLEIIKSLERKYGEGIDAVIKYKEEADKELKSLELSDERHGSIDAELRVKEGMLMSTALSLSEKRKKTAKKIQELVRTELRELAFNKAEFMIDIKQEGMSPHGIDKVEFLFSANPGEPLRPLAKIVSGGELSRCMLALKSILADYDSIPVLIFDEVDAGIGGKTAESVGKKLKKISDKHQVLCTTHLPQIASMGDLHLKIEKGQKNGRAYVGVKMLKGRERLEEIARMLSGKITDVSLKHAKELVESAV
ncbi:MAG: DNA repair protein RecN [Nitrospirae bacterium RBG_13_39_12]|nr:MAG: DNA repair protein RecN [Nitrospirae bacterium RBG_13_39_12]